MSMTKLRPGERFPTWKSESSFHRMLKCAGALCIHQFLTDGERRRVQERLEKWLRKNDVTPPEL